MQSRRSFTLVEILIALSILAVGIVVLFNIFPLSWQAFAYSRKLNEVSVLAQKKLEELNSSAVTPGQLSGKENDLDWNVSIASLQLEPGVEVFQAQLDIEFNFQGRPQKQRFVTYLSKK